MGRWCHHIGPDHCGGSAALRAAAFKEEIGAFEGGSVMYISVPTSDSHVISVETKLAVTHSHSHTLLAGGWLESTSQRE